MLSKFGVFCACAFSSFNVAPSRSYEIPSYRGYYEINLQEFSSPNLEIQDTTIDLGPNHYILFNCSNVNILTDSTNEDLFSCFGYLGDISQIGFCSYSLSSSDCYFCIGRETNSSSNPINNPSLYFDGFNFSFEDLDCSYLKVSFYCSSTIYDSTSVSSSGVDIFYYGIINKLTSLNSWYHFLYNSRFEGFSIGEFIELGSRSEGYPISFDIDNTLYKISFNVNFIYDNKLYDRLVFSCNIINNSISRPLVSVYDSQTDSYFQLWGDDTFQSERFNIYFSDSTYLIPSYFFETLFNDFFVEGYFYQPNYYDISDMFFSLVDTPIYAFKNMLSFELFGLPLYEALLSLISLICVIGIVKKIV